MLFNSLSYLIFFPLVTIIYFLIPKVKMRIFWLLIASYTFYMAWNPIYITLILLSTAVDFIVGNLIFQSKKQKKRHFYLLISVIINIGILFYFKYYNFLTESLEYFFSLLSLDVNIPQHHWLLPVGISFYTFQTLSYSIDIYRGKQEPEKKLLNFALYVSYFPQLVAGPVERPGNLLPQFHQKHVFNYTRIVEGLRLILIGFFKKVVVADSCAVLVNQVYNNPADYGGYSMWVATFFFVFQLFCDFSGYTDIARGSSRILGIELIENFTGPLFSKNVTEFWRRWHISLSTWIRDYVFTPFGIAMRNLGKYSYVPVIMITFVLFGIWHGANWTFVLFGFLQGVALIYETFTKKRRKKVRKKTPPWLYNGISIMLTFTFWFFSCLVFRANDFADMGMILGKMFSITETFGDSVVFEDANFTVNFYLTLFTIAIVLFIHYIEHVGNITQFIKERKTPVRWAIYFFLLFSIFTLGEFGLSNQFIYFEF